jgi:23S rRNA (guanosine2251-2'-O)-methyltransferase
MRRISGLQAVREAIRAHGGKLETVWIASNGGPQLDALERFAQSRGARVARVARGELDRMAQGARHQGAIADAPDLVLVPIETVMDHVRAHTNAVVLALDEIEDPQNFGALIRSAVGLGAAAVVWPEHHSAPLSAATFRASAGAVEHALLCRVSSLPRAIESLREAGATVVGLDATATQSIHDVHAEGSIVVVVGAEGKGLRGPVKKACSSLARLNMRGPIASLNASVAAGIALYTLLQGQATTSAPTDI